MHRFAAKRDGNEPIVIDALKAQGWRVLPLDKFDLLVYVPLSDRLFMIEVKNADGKDRGQSRTAQQKRILADQFPLHFVVTPDEAVYAIMQALEAK
jgi:hypothetical protein